MEVRLESKSAKPLVGVGPVVGEVVRRLQSEPQGWVKQLRDEPGAFRELEKTVHRAFQQMADRVVAGILAEATASAEFADDAKKRSLLSALQSPPLNG